MLKIMLTIGFELPSSGVGSDRSANWAVIATTARTSAFVSYKIDCILSLAAAAHSET